MIYVLDACCLINLVNGGVLREVLDDPMIEARVGPVVYEECKSIGMTVDTAIQRGEITLLDDSAISADLFLSLLDTYNLGAGETECIAFGKQLGGIVCTDDRRARHIVRQEIGGVWLSGSLGLLSIAVSANRIAADQAFSAYLKMRDQGAFLPRVSRSFFQS